MANSGNETWSTEDILEVARRQKQVLWVIPLSLIAVFIPYATIVSGVIQLYFIYKLAEALRSTAAWVYILLAFIPLIGLLGLLHINGKATKTLQSAGVRVGLMGAKSHELSNLTESA